MTDGLAPLCLAMALFVTTHLVLPAPPVRSALVARLGEKGFQGAFSLLALALMVWVASAYGDAPVIDVWFPTTGLMHIALTVMVLASILVVAGVTTANPLAVGGPAQDLLGREPRGVLAVTRHPVMWGIGLWGLSHLLANGTAADMVLFGGLTVTALGGALAQEHKKRVMLGEAWQAFAARTSYFPFAALVAGRARLRLGDIGWWRLGLGVALYAALFALHPWLFGISPLPL